MKNLTLSGADCRDMLVWGTEYMDRRRQFNDQDREVLVYALGRGDGKKSIHRIHVDHRDGHNNVFVQPRRVIRLWLSASKKMIS